MSALFTPTRLGHLDLPNRIIVSPMCQYVAVDGRANSWHLAHLGGLAQSGASMVIVEATAVEPAGRITPGCLGLWDDATEAALQPVVDMVRQNSNIALTLQIAHAGRKASSAVPWKGGMLLSSEDGGWETVAPSAIPQKEGETLPVALDAQGLARIKQRFVETAQRAARLGFDALELHAAHGYLLHQFLSPVSNHRTDAYGGSLENRMRLVLEVYDAVRAVFPADKPVGVKISASDWVEGGWDIEQSVELARALKSRGVAWITASSGGISPLQHIKIGPSYQVPFAERIKAETGVTTVAVGLVTEPQQADDIIDAGKADFVAIARGMLYDPRWGWHAAAALGGTVSAAPQYWRAPPHGHADLFGELVYGAR